MNLVTFFQSKFGWVDIRRTNAEFVSKITINCKNCSLQTEMYLLTECNMYLICSDNDHCDE